MEKALKLVTIKLISDTMWPNGMIGKRELLNAMKKFEDKFEFKVERVPFMLEPDYMYKGEDYTEPFE